MSAVVFLIIRQYANRVRRLFKKPLTAIITIFAVLAIAGGPVMVFFAPNAFSGLVGEQGRGIVVAGIQLFIGITLILSALSQQGGLFTYSEANVLFSSPMTKKTILLYSTLQTLPASILTALFMCFYFPYVIGSAMTPGILLVTLLITSLMIFCIYILYYYIYIQDIGHPGLKVRLRKVAWVLFSLIALIYLANWFSNGRDLKLAAITFFNSPIYHAFPIFGWAKWSVVSLLEGKYLTGFLPATALLTIAAFVLAKIYYSLDVDFFEKAQLDSIRLQKVVDSMKTSGYDASNLSIKKVRKASGEFRPGAGAIMSRQLLEMKKRGPFLSLKEFINGAIYIVIGLIAGLGFEFVFIMITFSLITSAATDTWNAEFKKPYIYLIPESSFKKLLYTTLPGFVKLVLVGSVTVLIASILFRVGLSDLLSYQMLTLSFSMLFMATGVLTYRIMGNITNALVLMFLRILFISLSIIPAALIAGVLYAAAGVLSFPAASATVLLVNLLLSLCIIFLCRRILDQTELSSQ